MTYVITPLMVNSLVRNVLKNKILVNEYTLLFMNEIPSSFKSAKQIVFVSKILLFEYKAIWYAAYQRAARKSATPVPNHFLVFALILKNLYVMLHLLDFSKRNNVIFLPTSEPYIESLILRLIARELRVSCVSYTAREYLGFVIEPYKFFPTVIDFENIISAIQVQQVDIQLTKVTYSTGGDLVSSIRPSTQNLEELDLSSSVVIFLHDLLDAPGIFGKGVFSSLQEWLDETIRTLTENRINYFIKPHPNQINASKRITAEFIKKNSLEGHIIDVSSAEILHGRPKLIVTNHGSISLEALLHNTPVLVSGQSIATHIGLMKPISDKKSYLDHLKNIKPNKLLKTVPNNLLDIISNHEYNYKIEKPILFDYSYLNVDPNIRTNEDLIRFCTDNQEFRKKQDSVFNHSDKEAFSDILNVAYKKASRKIVAIILTEDFTFDFYIKNLVNDQKHKFLILGRFTEEFIERNNQRFPSIIFEDIGISRRTIGLGNLITILKIMIKLVKYDCDQIVTLMPKANVLGQIAGLLTLRSKRYMISTGNIWLSHTGFTKYAFFMIERLCLMLAHVVVADSKSQYDLMSLSHPKQRHKLRYVNGLSVRNFPNTSQKKNRQSNLVIGHMGRLCFRKGTNFAIEVAQFLCERGVDLKFKFAGPVEDNMLDSKLKDLMQNYDGMIEFERGFFDFESQIKNVDILLMPSEFEGFGIAAVEAAKLDTMVIGFDVVGLKDSIGGDKLGHLVNFGDVDAMINLIIFYSQHRLELNSKIAKSKRNADRDFDTTEVTCHLRSKLDL